MDEIMDINVPNKVFSTENKIDNKLSQIVFQPHDKCWLESLTYIHGGLARASFKSIFLFLILFTTFSGISETSIITVTTSSSGRVDPSGAVSVNQDEDIALTTIPDNSYVETDKSTTDVSQSKASSYLSSRVNDGSSLSAIFLSESDLTAKTIYVDKNLVDDCADYDPNSRNCGSGNYIAYNTISEAASVAVAGDTVLIRQGLGASPEYREQLAPVNSGDPVNGYITFKGFPGEDVRIKGDRVPAVSIGIMLNNRSHIIIEGLNVRYVERYIRAENAHHIIIRNNTFTGAVWGGAAMKFLNADYNKIINNTITNSTGPSTDSIAFLIICCCIF